MYGLTTAALGHACQLFMDQAYPQGPDAIPAKKRAYYRIDPSSPLSDYLPPAPTSVGVCLPLSTRKDGPRGFEFRLGSAHFPHIKLRLQLVQHHEELLWVYTVDTHDAFSAHCAHPPLDHPDAAGWLALQDANRHLKEQVEHALEQAGFLTFKTLLKRELGAPVAR